MSTTETTFHEASLGSVPIRDMRLTIAGTRLEPIITEFRTELERAGIRRVRPHFYLSTEWGVPFGTVSVAIPFYLARADLVKLHAEITSHVEGQSRPDILRYLRHEMGHVVNYAYRLYERADWVQHFGAMTQPYIEEYRPAPFSRRYVRHLPGWYAQKHPDEDWAETFAVWLTPDREWRAEYAGWPTALAKLEFCARLMTELNERDPLVSTIDSDEEVGELTATLEQFYGSSKAAELEQLPGLDGALRAIFEDSGGEAKPQGLPAAALIRRIERDLPANVYQWTGHFPERTRRLVRHLATRAEQLHAVYPEEQERSVTVALTALVTALAMNYTYHGSYFP
jgi:hypothetical protein